MPTVLGFRPGRNAGIRPLSVRGPQQSAPQVGYKPQGGPGGPYGPDDEVPETEGPDAPVTPLPPPPVNPYVPRNGGTNSPEGGGGSVAGGAGSLNPPGSQYVYGPDGRPIAVYIPPPKDNPFGQGGGSYTLKSPEELAYINAQIESLKRQGRIAEAQMLMQQAALLGYYPRGGYDQNGNPNGPLVPTLDREKWGAETTGYVIDPATGAKIPTYAREGRDMDNAYRWGMATGFDPSGKPTLDRDRFAWQQQTDRWGNERADAAQRVSEGDLRLRADLGYANSRRADTTLNMGRQAQMWGQAQDTRANYRTDQQLGMARQGQMFDQRMKQRQEMIDLARRPQDYLTYAFMSGGVKPPPGVGLTDALARAGGPEVPTVDAYLGNHGMGSVRPTDANNPNVPDLDSYLNSQAPRVA